MSEESPLRVGDRVITLQVPGIFTVVARQGRMIEIENARGQHLRMYEVALRRVNGKPAEPKDS